MNDAADEDAYALKARTAKSVAAPALDYQPPKPRAYAPRIAVVGAGGISFAHLDAYRRSGCDVALICNRTLAKAAARRDEFFPNAEISSDFNAVLARTDIGIVDITTHPAGREVLIEQAMRAGKHVLSQKPFVLDLGVGEHLADLADQFKVKLAVNQNGRWAPHLAYMRQAVRAGHIGDIISCHIGIHWNHGWIEGTPFEEIDDLIFFDFAIHWFDFLASLIGDRATWVYATRAHALEQTVKPALLAQALVQFNGGQASFTFDGSTHFGPQDRTYIAGTQGSLTSVGPDLGDQRVELSTKAGTATPVLSGSWFNDGFAGAMGELLSAIEDDRTPLNGARDNLQSLALTFAAIASSHRGVPVAPGTVRSLAEATRSKD